MDPIISPWLIWLIEVCSTAKCISYILLIITGVIFAISGWVSITDEIEENVVSSAKRIRKISLLLFILIAPFMLIIPNKETATKMVIANYITQDNVNTITQNGKEEIDYIFDKIEDLSNGGHNEERQ